MQKKLTFIFISACLATSSILAMEGTRIILECAGTAKLFEPNEFKEKLKILASLSPEAIEVKGQKLSLEQKEQVKKSFLSCITYLDIKPITSTFFLVDSALITSMPTPDDAEQSTRNVLIPQQTLAQTILNPTTLGFTALCVLTTYLATKHVHSNN